MSPTEALDFFFELGQLRRTRHEGWTLAGIDSPESVAQHSLRAAQIGFVLAHLADFPDPMRVTAMAVFHEIGECRTGDIHKVANRYVTADEGRAVADQLEPLGTIGDQIRILWEEAETQATEAGILARDADLLEQALTAKEYEDRGFKAAADWRANISRLIRSSAASSLLDALDSTHSTAWWRSLKRFSGEQATSTPHPFPDDPSDSVRS